jgi:hypothetical protein
VAATTPPAARTDAVFIKHLNATIGVKAAEVSNRLPLFIMSEESDEILRHERELPEAAPDILPV